MHKKFKFHDDALNAIEKGVETLAKAVKSTLGPRGKNVIITRKFAPPFCTKDGVTVAEEVVLEDHFENIGAQLLKEAASKTASAAGDGTTTAIVLAEAIFKNGLRHIKAEQNPIELQRGINIAVEKICEHLSSIASPIDSFDDVRKIATISANNDPEIGKIIGDAMEKVGKDGIITMEDSHGCETYFSVAEGMQFDRGYCSPLFVTDKEKAIAEHKNANILIINKKISTVKDIIPILQKAVHEDKLPLIVIADDIDGEALSTLVLNKVKASIPVCAVKSPAFGDRRKAILEDIAILTNATVINDDLGINLCDLTTDCFGKCKSIKISREETIIIDGEGNPEEIASRISLVKREISEATPNTYDHTKLKERLAKLVGGIAVIHVGAHTDADLTQKKARVEDALQATRAAVAEGVVTGGGAALLHSLHILDTLDVKETVRLGVDIVRKSCYAPLTEIANNCGLIGSSVALAVESESNPNYGFDAMECKFGDMREREIVDPVRVTKSALTNAASIASLLLSTSAMMVEIEDKQDFIPKSPVG